MVVQKIVSSGLMIIIKFLKMWYQKVPKSYKCFYIAFIEIGSFQDIWKKFAYMTYDLIRQY